MIWILNLYILVVCGTRTKCIISLNVQASTCTHIIFLFVIYKNETKRTYVKDISITKTDWFDMLWEIYKLFIEIFFLGCKDLDKNNFKWNPFNRMVCFKFMLHEMWTQISIQSSYMNKVQYIKLIKLKLYTTILKFNCSYTLKIYLYKRLSTSNDLNSILFINLSLKRQFWRQNPFYNHYILYIHISSYLFRIQYINSYNIGI